MWKQLFVHLDMVSFTYVSSMWVSICNIFSLTLPVGAVFAPVYVIRHYVGKGAILSNRVVCHVLWVGTDKLKLGEVFLSLSLNT